MQEEAPNIIMKASVIVGIVVLFHMGCVCLANQCTGKSNGYYPDPNNCYGYITCSNGIVYQRPCPAGLKWNDEDKICDWPANANPPCPVPTTTEPPTTTSKEIVWTEYSPYWCTLDHRTFVEQPVTKQQCKDACTGDCKAIEWWPGRGLNYCYKCLDPSKRQLYTNKYDRAYPPIVIVKSQE